MDLLWAQSIGNFPKQFLWLMVGIRYLGFWNPRQTPADSQLSFSLRTEDFQCTHPCGCAVKNACSEMDRPVAHDLLARKPIEAGLKTSPKICNGKDEVGLFHKFRLEMETLPTKRETSHLTGLTVSAGVIFRKCTVDRATASACAPVLGAQVESHAHIAKYRAIMHQFKKPINRICSPSVWNMPFCWQNINTTCKAMVFI